MAEAPSKGAPVAKRLRKLTDKVLDGLAIEDMRCVSCSGYGNCGYKSMFLKDEGGVASVCMRRRKMAQCARDDVEYSDELLKEDLG